MIEIDIQLFPHHPIRKLLIPINQSSYLICCCRNFFDRAKKTNMYEIKSSRLRSQTDLFYFSSFIFEKVTVSLKKSNPSKKIVIVEEELDRIDIDIGNLEDSPRLVFIDEECGNLIVEMVENLLEILTKERSQTFYSNL